VDVNKLTKSDLENISGGNEEEFLNTCKKCGKVWDIRNYGYGESAIPCWVVIRGIDISYNYSML